MLTSLLGPHGGGHWGMRSEQLRAPPARKAVIWQLLLMAHTYNSPLTKICIINSLSAIQSPHSLDSGHFWTLTSLSKCPLCSGTFSGRVQPFPSLPHRSGIASWGHPPIVSARQKPTYLSRCSGKAASNTEQSMDTSGVSLLSPLDSYNTVFGLSY